MATIPAEIFKAYDIRGIVDKTLTTEGVETIGRAIGSEARARSVQSVVVGRHLGPHLRGNKPRTAVLNHS